MSIAVRPAIRADMPLIASLIRGLAEYEGLDPALKLNAGPLPMSNGLTRLETRMLATPAQRAASAP